MDKQRKIESLKVSAGLFVGYLMALCINVLFFEKSWSDSFADIKTLLGSAVGIILGYLLIKRGEKKELEENAEE